MRIPNRGEGGGGGREVNHGVRKRGLRVDPRVQEGIPKGSGKG
jgi:hypothetical protein